MYSHITFAGLCMQLPSPQYAYKESRYRNSTEWQHYIIHVLKRILTILLQVIVANVIICPSCLIPQARRLTRYIHVLCPIPTRH